MGWFHVVNLHGQGWKRTLYQLKYLSYAILQKAHKLARGFIFVLIESGDYKSKNINQSNQIISATL